MFTLFYIIERMTDDVEIFYNVIGRMIKDFQNNPFQYAAEGPFLDELYYRLRAKIENCHLPVTFKTDYGTKMREYRKKNLMSSGKANGKSEALRIRREVSFMENGLPWKFQDSWWKFDLTIFEDNEDALVMHSKKMGIGNHLDVQNEISVLCEIKHSRNMGNRFYHREKGAKDIRALSKFPKEGVREKNFIFIDWWPIDWRGKKRFDKHRQKLNDSLEGLTGHVKILYIPRKGGAKIFSCKNSFSVRNFQDFVSSEYPNK